MGDACSFIVFMVNPLYLDGERNLVNATKITQYYSDQTKKRQQTERRTQVPLSPSHQPGNNLRCSYYYCGHLLQIKQPHYIRRNNGSKRPSLWFRNSRRAIHDLLRRYFVNAWFGNRGAARSKITSTCIFHSIPLFNPP
jgi:hypothetical protein